MPLKNTAENCAAMSLTTAGEPVRISICHCLECQRRTGSVFGAQARFRREQVTIDGRAAEYQRKGDSGNPITFRFCPACGSTVYWTLSALPELIAITVGAFADPRFPAPRVSVYERRRHGWAWPAPSRRPPGARTRRSSSRGGLLIIFARSTVPGQPDRAFEAEAEAVRTLGIDHSVISYEALQNERRPARAVRRVTAAEPPRGAIYRGWMLRPSEYAALYDALMAKGIELVNCRRPTATATICRRAICDAGRTAKSAAAAVGRLLDGCCHGVAAGVRFSPAIEDYVKSQKHYWHEACFIESAADAAAVERVVRRFLELQGDSLNEGLVFREFVAFEPLAEHSRSGMPMTREFRMFVRDGDVRCCAPYWGEGRYEGAVPSADEFSDVTRRVQSRFLAWTWRGSETAPG
jgi:hypothetical protein